MKKVWMLTFLLFMLSGCGGTQINSHPVRVVTQIRVTGTENGHTWQKTFSGPEKMDAVLLCLRQLEPGKAVNIDPESFRTDNYKLVVSYSDGNYTVYHQLFHHYLQTDGADYRQIREAPAARLAQLLKELPTDPLPVS